ncbi:HNH endonuclease [Mycobacterium phage BigCheese]|nr:HNH endonuclease [Mycobacterium phage BigCheese]
MSQPPKCAVEWCVRPVRTAPYCLAHYQRSLMGRDMDKPLKRMPGEVPLSCEADGCDGPVKAKGLCGTHYHRQRYVPKPLRVDISYNAAHSRVKALWGPARQYQCVACDSRAANWAYDGTDPDQRYGPASGGESFMYYSTFPEFYMPMCKKCHLRMDGRLAAEELREYREWKLRTGLTLRDLERTAG